MNIRFIVELTPSEQAQLRDVVSKGQCQVRRVKRAQVLLGADAGASDEAIARTVSVGTSTVFRTRRRYVEGGVEHALSEQPRQGRERKLSGEEEALLVAITCSNPPTGRQRWTLELLAGELVRRTEHEAISPETIRRRLAEQQLKPWQKRMWCIREVDAPFIAQMEDVLELYCAAPDPARPVVCFDETPAQLIAESRVPVPPTPGQRLRYDYEYRRNGVANLFVFLDAHQPWRHVKVTERKTALDFAVCMQELAEVHYRDAELIRVVLDNFSAHKPAALYEAFSPERARALLKRLEFHYTPTHASWLNMVEIEIGVLMRQCLDRRIPDREALVHEVGAWERMRNAEGARVRWMFNIQSAREKLRHAYPTPALESWDQAA
jgi:transposase